MDVGAATQTEFFGAGMRAIAQDKSQWDNLTAPQVAALLDASITKPSAYTALRPLDGTATYVIQTREGGKGILQILGSTDDGVKIRYKLVQGTNTAAKVTPPSAQEPVVIHIPPSGVLSIGPEQFERPQLVTRLKAFAALQPQPAVILRADLQTGYQRVIDVLEACKEARLTNVAFAKPQESEQKAADSDQGEKTPNGTPAPPKP